MTKKISWLTVSKLTVCLHRQSYSKTEEGRDGLRGTKKPCKELLCLSFYLIHYFYILPLSLNHCFYTTALCVQVKNWPKAYKKKANITTKVGSNKIDKIQEELGKIERVEDWDGVDMSKPLLFPSVEIPHLSRGEEAAC